MAKEAVIRIKDAEDAAAEAIRTANEKARLIAENSHREALEEKDAIIKSAIRMKETLIANAKTDAEKQCEPIIAEGQGEIVKILNPDSAKFEQAVKTVMERIVSVNGNR